MLPILDFLQVLGQLHLGVEQPVFVDVLLVLDLVLIRQLGKSLLMLFLQLGHSLVVLFLGLDLLFLAAGHNCLIIIGVVVSLQVALSVGNQLGDLGFVLGFHGAGLFLLFLGLLDPLVLFLLGVDSVTLEVIDQVLILDDLIGAVFPQSIDLILNFSYILVYRLAKLLLLLSRENL